MNVNCRVQHTLGSIVSADVADFFVATASHQPTLALSCGCAVAVVIAWQASGWQKMNQERPPNCAVLCLSRARRKIEEAKARERYEKYVKERAERHAREKAEQAEAEVKAREAAERKRQAEEEYNKRKVGCMLLDLCCDSQQVAVSIGCHTPAVLAVTSTDIIRFLARMSSISSEVNRQCCDFNTISIL